MVSGCLELGSVSKGTPRGRLALVDTHSHLDEVEDLEQAIRRAGEVGVLAIVTVGSNHASNIFSLEIAQRQGSPKIYPALGIHPWNIETAGIESSLSFIEENVDRAVAIGEVGLDYWLRDVRKDSGKKELQMALLKKLLGIAKRHGKPVIIHSRGAWRDCFDMVSEANVELAVFHWFSGPLEVLRGILERNYLISATPAAAYSKEHRAAIEKTPLENILLETDSPVQYGGKASEPADVTIPLEAVASLKNVSVAAVASKTTENAARVFGIRTLSALKEEDEP